MPAKRLAKSVAFFFGAESRGARAAAAMTQQLLAEKIEVDPIYISLLENGHRQPSLAVVLNLERILGLDSGELSRRVAKRLLADGVWQSPKRQRKTN